MSAAVEVSKFLNAYGFPIVLPPVLPLKVALELQDNLVANTGLRVDLPTLELCYLAWKRQKESLSKEP